MTLDLCVLGIGVLGPGLADWTSAAPLLREPARWRREPTAVPPPARLPPTERRRAGTVVKASLVAADQALADADAATLPTVFASSTGDPLNCHQLCEALARPPAERAVSPTKFTNSVHNAPAGYWHIAAASRAASTSIAAFDASFGAALFEAALQAAARAGPVLLVACDMPYPEPLHAKRPVADAFAVALRLAPAGAGGRAMRLQPAPGQALSACADAALDELRRTIPAARALPLLQALAGTAAAQVVIEGAPGWPLAVEVAAT